MQGPAQQHVSDAGPDLPLLVQRLDLAHCPHLGAQAEQLGQPSDEFDCVSRSAALVQPTGRREDAGFVQPVLECLAGHVWTQFLEEEVSEIGVLSFSE